MAAPSAGFSAEVTAQRGEGHARARQWLACGPLHCASCGAAPCPAAGRGEVPLQLRGWLGSPQRWAI